MFDDERMVSRGFIWSNDGRAIIRPGFDWGYYKDAKLSKPRRNKNYQKKLELYVDSEMYLSVAVPVGMLAGVPPMAEIELRGEVAREFINAPVEERERILIEFFGDNNWRNMVDEVLMNHKEEGE